MLTLWRLWRNERTDPQTFYDHLADRAVVDLEHWFGPLNGQLIADVGCGPGWYTRAFRRAGAEVLPIDADEDELARSGERLEGAVIGDAMALPFEDGSVDGLFSSNMLEHTPDSRRVLTEFQRVLRPGGWVYLSWTNWLSPWGGHDMTPYHFLGPKLGVKLYQQRHGHDEQRCIYGVSLWPVHIGSTLRFIRSLPDIQILATEPRYWPRLRFLASVPILREFVTWNCVVRMRKWTDSGAVPSY
jgi:SAM-dependent methyltransferase